MKQLEGKSVQSMRKGTENLGELENSVEDWSNKENEKL